MGSPKNLSLDQIRQLHGVFTRNRDLIRAIDLYSPTKEEQQLRPASHVHLIIYGGIEERLFFYLEKEIAEILSGAPYSLTLYDSLYDNSYKLHIDDHVIRLMPQREDAENGSSIQ